MVHVASHHPGTATLTPTFTAALEISLLTSTEGCHTKAVSYVTAILPVPIPLGNT